MEITVNGFIISDDKRKLQLDRICELLHTTHWAKNRHRDIVEKSLQHSLCFGIYSDGTQIGFARCVTDYAAVYWIDDVVIDGNYKGLGLGKALVQAMTEHELLKTCSGYLITSDAHKLYEKYGFSSTQGLFMSKFLD